MHHFGNGPGNNSQKSRSKIPCGSLEILNWASMCHPGKSQNWIPLVSFAWHGLRDLLIIFILFHIFRWDLFQVVNCNIVKIKYKPWFLWHTLIAKRNMIFKNQTDFELDAVQFELFYDLSEMTYRQTFDYLGRTVRNFRMGFFASHYQDHLTKSSRPYVRVSDPGAPGKMDRFMLRFFWKRLYHCLYDLSVLVEGFW